MKNRAIRMNNSFPSVLFRIVVLVSMLALCAGCHHGHHGGGSTDTDSTAEQVSANAIYVLTQVAIDNDADGQPDFIEYFSYVPVSNLVRMERQKAGTNDATYRARFTFDSSGNLAQLNEDIINNGTFDLRSTYFYNDSPNCRRIEYYQGQDVSYEVNIVYRDGEDGSAQAQVNDSNHFITNFSYQPGDGTLTVDYTDYNAVNCYHLSFDSSGKEVQETLDRGNDGVNDKITKNFFDENGNLSRTEVNELSSVNDETIDAIYTYTWELQDITPMTFKSSYLTVNMTNKNDASLVWLLVRRHMERDFGN